MKKWILILLCSLLEINYSNSQGIYLGTSFGYGGGYIDDQAEFSKLFDENAFDNYEYSIMVSYKPTKPIFEFNSGITYQMFSSGGEHLRFLKVPLNMDFRFGEKYLFIIGFGLYSQFYLSNSENSYYEYSDFQAGFNTNIGIGYVLNDRYSFFLKLRKDNDFLKLYKEPIPSHFGDDDYRNNYSYKCSLNICIYYKLQQKK